MTSITYKTVEARRFGTVNQPANINNNSTLTMVVGGKDTLNIGFVFSCNYEPNIGVIRIEGDMELKESEDNVSRALTEWDTSGHKNLPKDIAEKVHNTILSNCVIEASILARDIQLPAPLPVPQVQLKKDESPDTQNYIR